MDASQSPKAAAKRSNTPAIIGLVVLLLVAGGLGFFAWKSLRPHNDKIGEILADLRTYDEKLVTVEGTAIEPTNLLMLKFFTLKDDTGEITVVTERGLPSDGAQVRVQGYVKQVFSIGNMQKTVIMEPAGDDSKQG